MSVSVFRLVSAEFDLYSSCDFWSDGREWSVFVSDVRVCLSETVKGIVARAPDQTIDGETLLSGLGTAPGTIKLLEALGWKRVDRNTFNIGGGVCYNEDSQKPELMDDAVWAYLVEHNERVDALPLKGDTA